MLHGHSVVLARPKPCLPLAKTQLHRSKINQKSNAVEFKHGRREQLGTTETHSTAWSRPRTSTHPTAHARNACLIWLALLYFRIAFLTFRSLLRPWPETTWTPHVNLLFIFRGSFSQTSSQLLYKFVICRAEVVVCACLWRRADTWVAQAMNWIALAGFNRPYNETRRKMPKLLKRWDISFALLISFLSQGINNAIGTDSPREETQ